MTAQQKPEEPEIQEQHVQLRPLMRCKNDGTPYTRSCVVEDQIRCALSLEPDELVNRAEIDDWKTPHPHYLKEECLVYMIDAYRHRGDWGTTNALTKALLQRCVGIIRKGLKALGSNDAEEAEHDVVAQLLEELMDPFEKGAFLQVAFGMRLQRLVIQTYNKYKSRQEKGGLHQHVTLDTLAGHQPSGIEESSQVNVDDSWEGDYPSPDELFNDKEKRECLYQALEALPAKLRTAVVLYYLEGYPLTSQNENDFTLSKHFDEPGETVRNWIRKARKLLAQWMEDHE